ncbi:MAG: CoA protein activase [Syntrophomonadaceae bacterium]|nr:CoA protein activase [Syntrophomonadaceae bacterium]
MRITFPHMGNSHIAISSLLRELGLDVVVPPPCTRRTLELGARYSPEFVCLPLKLNLGNMLEALEKGADTVLMAGGWGPCRFGYYAQIERDILEDLGHSFQMIIIEAPDSNILQLIKQVRNLGIKVSWRQLYSAMRMAWAKLKAIDYLEERMHYWLPRAINKIQVEKTISLGFKRIDRCSEQENIPRILEDVEQQLSLLPAATAPAPLRIGLVGEIYTILEPFANYNIENQLGRLGSEVVRTVYMSQWVNDHLFGGYLSASSLQNILKYADPYLKSWVGGHGRETVASTVQFAHGDVDGVIQVAPLTCMPEIVAQAVLNKVQEVEGIPVMTMYFDEHAGEAGIITRLEAFLDMIRWKNAEMGKISYG